MTALAHIRNGELIATYRDGRGQVHLEAGGVASPPVAGFINGADRVVPVVLETLDASTGRHTRQKRARVVEADRVVDRTTIEDIPREEWLAAQRVRAEIPTFQFARAAVQAGKLTPQEGGDWINNGIIPAVVEAIISALPISDAEKDFVRFEARSAPTIKRDALLMPGLQQAFNANDDEVDGFFGIEY